MGTIAVTKRLKGVKDVKAFCIYDGDDFEQEFDLDTCTLKITKFNPKFENVDINKIKGAFAVIMGEHGPLHVEVMNISQIRNSWNQGYAKGGSGAHKNFTDQMVKKTVINRACKLFANTSDDSDILISAFNNSQSVDDDESLDKSNLVDNVEYEVKEEVNKEANSKSIDIKTEENEKVVDVNPTPVNNPAAHTENSVQGQEAQQTTLHTEEPDF
jgi:recombination protein RecT